MRTSGDDRGGGAAGVVLRKGSKDSEPAVGRAGENETGGKVFARRGRQRGRRLRAVCDRGPQDVGFVKLDGSARGFAGGRRWRQDAEEAVGAGGSVAAEPLHGIRSGGGGE